VRGLCPVTSRAQPVSAPAARAGAPHDDVVCGNRVATRTCDALQSGLEPRVLERLDLAALVADEMVVVLASRVGALEARDTVAEIDPLHEPRVDEPFDGAVHAGDPHPAAFGAHAVVDLLHRQAAVLPAHEVDDDPPRSTAAAALGT